MIKRELRAEDKEKKRVDDKGGRKDGGHTHTICEKRLEIKQIQERKDGELREQ